MALNMGHYLRSLLQGEQRKPISVRGWVRRYKTPQGFCSLIGQLLVQHGKVINAVHGVFLSTRGSYHPSRRATNLHCQRTRTTFCVYHYRSLRRADSPVR